MNHKAQEIQLSGNNFSSFAFVEDIVDGNAPSVTWRSARSEVIFTTSINDTSFILRTLESGANIGYIQTYHLDNFKTFKSTTKPNTAQINLYQNPKNIQW